MAEQGYNRENVVQGSCITWDAMATGDTATPYEIVADQGVAGCIQATGTFNGGTAITVQVSNDGDNWFDLADLQGDAISITADGYAEFTTAARHIKPVIASGSSDSVVPVMMLRG